MKTGETEAAYQKRRRRGISIIMTVEVLIFCWVMYYTH